MDLIAQDAQIIASFIDELSKLGGMLLVAIGTLVTWALWSFRKNVEEKGERLKKLEDRLDRTMAQNRALLFRLAVLEAGSQGLPLPFWIKDKEFRFVFVNEEYERRFLSPMGKTIADAMGRTDAEVFGEETAMSWRGADMEVQRTGEPVHSSGEEIHLSNGDIVGVEIIKFPVRGHSLAVGGVVVREWLKGRRDEKAD